MVTTSVIQLFDKYYYFAPPELAENLHVEGTGSSGNWK